LLLYVLQLYIRHTQITLVHYIPFTFLKNSVSGATMMCEVMTLWGKTGLGARKIKEQGMND